MNHLLNAGIGVLALVSIFAIFLEPNIIWAYAFIAALAYGGEWLRKRIQNR